jgi:phospholipid-translocating ATPase
MDKSLNKNMLGAYLYETMLSFLVCNNVTPIYDGSERTLQAASPDEVSLVSFGEEMGFVLEERKLHSLTIRTPNGESVKFSIIQNFPFSSERKVFFCQIIIFYFV